MRGPHTSVRTALAPAATLMVLLLPAPAPAADHAVTFAHDSNERNYTPSDLSIAVNDTVTFTGSFSEHPLAWTDGPFATKSAGASATYAFATPGSFRFLCTEHGNMKGIVRVAAAAPGNQLPSADFTLAPAAPKAGETVTFTASGTDPDGTIARFEWDLDGDGTFEAQGATATRAFASAGTHRVAVRSVDNAGGASPATSHDVVVTAAPDAGPGAAADTAAPGARLLATVLRPRGGVVGVGLDLDEAARVRGTLRAAGRTLARADRALGPGRKVALRLTLTRAGRAALRRSARVRATLTLVLRDAAGNRRTVTRKVTLRR